MARNARKAAFSGFSAPDGEALGRPRTSASPTLLALDSLQQQQLCRFSQFFLLNSNPSEFCLVAQTVGD